MSGPVSRPGGFPSLFPWFSDTHGGMKYKVSGGIGFFLPSATFCLELILTQELVQSADPDPGCVGDVF